MKKFGTLRDVLIVLCALGFGLAVVWAGNSSSIDVLVTVLTLALPVAGLALFGAQQSGRGFDNDFR